MEHEKEAWQVNIHCNNKLPDLSMQGGEMVSVGIRLVRGKLSGTKATDEVYWCVHIFSVFVMSVIRGWRG